MVRLWGEDLSYEQVDLFYYVNNVYMIDAERTPSEEDVLGILTIAEKKEKIPRYMDCSQVFKKFADSEHPQTKWHRHRVQQKMDELNEKANDAYKVFLGENEDARQRATIFKGV